MLWMTGTVPSVVGVSSTAGPVVRLHTVVDARVRPLERHLYPHPPVGVSPASWRPRGLDTLALCSTSTGDITITTLRPLALFTEELFAPRREVCTKAPFFLFVVP